METLLTAWRSESAFRPVYRHLTLTQSGLELGAGTVIVPAANDNGGSLLKIDDDPARILALLSVAYNRPLAPALLKHLRDAARCWSRGDSVSAMIHIAFTGLPGLEKDGAFRLFLADRLLRDGLDQGEVLKGLGLLPQGLDPWEWQRLAKYDPDEARNERGRWTDGGLGDTMMTVAASADTTENKGSIAPARLVSAMAHGKSVEIMHSDNSVETRTGGSRSWRNNNPGNIEYGQFSRNHGAIASDGRFAIFPDEETGMKALDALLDTKGYKDLTVDGCIARRSPPEENPTKRLQSEVRNASGLSGDAKISDLTPEQRRAYIKALRHSEGWIVGKTSNGS